MLISILALLLCSTGEAIPPSQNAVTLQQNLNKAIASSKLPTFNIPTNEYHFNSATFLIHQATNLLITAEPNTTFWFEAGAGVKLSQCSNVKILGHQLKIDYDPLPFMQVTVVNITNKTLLLTSDKGFPSPTQFWKQWHNNPMNEFMQGPQWWDGTTTNYPLIQSSFSGYNYETQMKSLGNNLYQYNGSLPSSQPIQIGDKMTNVIRTGFTYFVSNSTNITSQNITIHSSSFMAITEFDGICGNRYESIKVIRRTKVKQGYPLPLVACNADVFHSSGCQKGPIVKYNEYSYAFDDYLNVHSRTQINVGVVVTDDTSLFDATAVNYIDLLVVDPRLHRDAGLIDDGPYGVVETFTNLQTGYHLRLLNITTLQPVTIDLEIISYFKVKDATLIARAKETMSVLSNNKDYHPKMQSFDVEYLNHITQKKVSRVWQIRVALPPPTADTTNVDIATVLDQMLISELVEWNNEGAVFER